MKDLNSNEMDPPIGQGPSFEGATSIPTILKRWRWMIATCIAVSLLIGVIYWSVAKRRYVSTARVYVQQAGPRLMGETRNELAMGAGDDFLSTQAQVIRSSAVMAVAVSKVKHVDSLKGNSNVIEHLRNSIEADIGKRDGVISISYEGRDPEDVAAIVNGVVAAYIEFQTSERMTTAQSILAVLKKDKAQRAAELTTRTQELLELQKKHGPMSLAGEDSTMASRRVTKLSDALSQSAVDVIDARAAYQEAVRTLNIDPEKLLKQQSAGDIRNFAPASTEQDVQTRMQVILGLQQQLRDAERTYLSGHSRIVSLRLQIEQAIVGHLAALKARMDTASKRQEELQADFDRQQKAFNEASINSMEFNRLRSEIRRLEKLTDQVNDRINEVEMSGYAPSQSISVLDPALPAESASWPRASRVLAMSIAAGLLLGIGLAMAMEFADVRIRSSAQMASLTDAPILGTIPQIADLDATENKLAALVNPMSMLAEASRMIRTSLLRGKKVQRQTIMVASATPEEGKSTVASALAVSLAQLGKRVLLVDADMRRPVQHKTFKVANEVGLSTVLSEECTWQSAVQASGVIGLELLVSTNEAEAPAELLNNPHFEEVLEELQGQYDFVVIDTPPVTAVADSRIVAGICDSVVFVVRAEHSHRKHCRNAIESLKMVGARIAGVVVNSVAQRQAGDYGAPSDYYSSRTDFSSPTVESSHRNADRSTGKLMREKVPLFGVQLSPTNYKEVAEQVVTWATEKRGGLVDFMPVHGLITAARNDGFRKAINSFDIVAPDGQPVRWAMNFFHKTGMRDRVYGPQCMLEVCARAEEAGVSIYLLGTTPDTLELLEDNLRAKFPKLQIAGMESPPFRALTAEEDQALIERINQSGAGIVFIGLGCPKQEQFAFDHSESLQAVKLCVGAAFDFHAGQKKMAPRWMQDRGLEWLFRVSSEPRRLFWRYTVTNSLYCMFVVREFFTQSKWIRSTSFMKKF